MWQIVREPTKSYLRGPTEAGGPGTPGPLSAHESGLLVTSGRFTDDAKTEAQEVTRAAIALVNGDKLIDLLLEHQIGATERRYTLYTLDPSALELESLKARTEST